jgi:hypothetical protein
MLFDLVLEKYCLVEYQFIQHNYYIISSHILMNSAGHVYISAKKLRSKNILAEIDTFSCTHGRINSALAFIITLI